MPRTGTKELTKDRWFGKDGSFRIKIVGGKPRAYGFKPYKKK